MKIIRTLLLLFLFSLTVKSHAAASPSNLKNWDRLDYMLRGTVPFKYVNESIEIELTKWNSKIQVSLEGNYTISDSLELDKAIKAFNEIIPNPGIGWATNQKPSLIVQFVNLTDEFYLHHVNWYSIYGLTPKTFLNHRFKITLVREGVLMLDNNLPEDQRQPNIWSGLGKIILEYKGTGLSLGPETVMGGKIKELTDFDRFFFKTVYADNFIDQYLMFLKEKYSFMDQFRYLTDKNTQNNIILSLQLIFIFLLTYFFYQFLWVKWLEKKISGKLKRFYISGLVFFTPQILVSLLFIIPGLLKLQHLSQNTLSYLLVGIVGFLFFLIVYSLFTFIAYFIEHVLFGSLHDYNQRQMVRIVSVTAILIPFALIYLKINRPQILIGMQMLVILLSFALIIVIRFLYFHNQHQKEIIQKHQQLKVEKLEQLQTKSQLEAIQARTNPHFLYNSLNTIAALIKIDTVKAEEFALKLSKLLRLRLNESKPAELPIDQEIETIRLYLEIEKERFGDRLEYSIVIAEDTKNRVIPSDLLLYLVENSIKHGISKQTGKGIVKVEITSSENQVKMCVADNGPDFPNNPIYGTGLKSILEKLELLYMDNYELALFNHPNKHVEIKFQRT